MIHKKNSERIDFFKKLCYTCSIQMGKGGTVNGLSYQFPSGETVFTVP